MELQISSIISELLFKILYSYHFTNDFNLDFYKNCTYKFFHYVKPIPIFQSYPDFDKHKKYRQTRNRKMHIFILLVFLHFEKLMLEILSGTTILSELFFNNIFLSIFHKTTSKPRFKKKFPLLKSLY